MKEPRVDPVRRKRVVNAIRKVLKLSHLEIEHLAWEGTNVTGRLFTSTGDEIGIFLLPSIIVGEAQKALRRRIALTLIELLNEYRSEKYGVQEGLHLESDDSDA